MSAVNYASLAVISGYDILVTSDESELCVKARLSSCVIVRSLKSGLRV